MTRHEHDVLRILNGEDMPGWHPGAAMSECLGWLKEAGYAAGLYHITRKGMDFLSKHPAWTEGIS